MAQAPVCPKPPEFLFVSPRASVASHLALHVRPTPIWAIRSPRRMVPAASDARTLLDVLDWHASQHPGRLHLTVLQDETTVTETLTYGELASRSRAVARGLVTREVASGDRVALMLPTGAARFCARSAATI